MKPPAGITLSLEGEIFSETDIVNVTLPKATSEFRSHGPAGPLSLGQIVGVVIGGVLVILAIMGFCVVMNGKRRRKAFLRRREAQHKNWPSPPAGSEMFETPVSQRPLRNWDGSPVSQRPLRNWDESPISAVTDPAYPGRYFSPYSSQFTSPVSAADRPGGGGDHQHHHVGWPAEKAQHHSYNNIGVAISPESEHGHNAFWGDKKGKDRVSQPPPAQPHDGYGNADEYEMQEGVSSAGGYTGHHEPQQHQQYYQNTAPVLEHPGYGRRGRE